MAASAILPSASFELNNAAACRNKANLTLSEVRSKLAVTDHEKTIQVAFREVADARTARATIAEEVAAQQAV